MVRCSFSFFPFGVSDWSPKRCPKSETGVPKSVQKGTKWSPKRSTWLQNGTKMTTVGPKWPIRGSNTIFGGPGPRKIVQNGSQNGPKIDQKIIQKNSCFLKRVRMRFSSVFYPFPPQNGAKMEPGGHQNRHKNRFRSKKQVFVLIQQNKGFQRGQRGSGLPFSRPQAITNR